MNEPQDIESRINDLIKFIELDIEKGGPGSGRLNIMDNVSKGDELARNMIKIKKAKKVKAFVQIQKAISLVQGYTPMAEDELKKSFEGREIPEIMHKEENRPPKEWFDTCVNKSKDITDDAPAYCCSVWKGVEKCDEGKKKWKELSESFTKMAEEIGKCEKSDEISEALGKAIAKALSEFPDIQKIAPALLAALPALAGAAGSLLGGKEEKSTEVTQKAVAEKVETGTKPVTDLRKPETDEGGESDVKGDPTKGKVKDLMPSATQKEEKADVPKI